MFQILLLGFIGFITFILVLILRTISIPLPDDGSPNEKCELIRNLALDYKEAINRLAKSLTYATISYESGQKLGPEFQGFIGYLEKAFPLVHACPWIERRIINNGSLLYFCQAKNPEAKPWIIIAHTDVVPVEPQKSEWTADPFGANVVKDERGKSYLYGRGSMDAKHIVMATLETLEHILNSTSNGQAMRLAHASLYLCFGHDEETGGMFGAKLVAEELTRQYAGKETKPFSFVIDEGTNVYHKIPVLQGRGQRDKLLAVISVTEKSSLRLKLSIETAPGHASMPAKENAITLMARAVRRLQAHQFNAQLGSVDFVNYAIDRLLPHINSFPARFLLVNRHIFRPIIAKLCERNPLANSLIRSTSCVVMFNGGIKDNVIPSHASAVINQRIFPTQTVEEVMKIDRKVIDDDSIKLEKLLCGNRIPIADHKSHAYACIEKSIMQTFGPHTIVIPGILPACTDSNHFLHLADNVYRFSPLLLRLSDNKRIHGIDERIDVTTYPSCVQFYHQLMLNVSGLCES